VTPVFLFSVVLWGPVQRRAAELEAEGEPPIQALLLASDEIVDAQQGSVAIPRRITTPMKEMMVMQLRLQKIRGRRVLGMLGQGRFRAAYDFLCLRAQVGDADPELAAFWTGLQQMGESERLAAVDPGGRRKGDGGDSAAPVPQGDAGEEGAPRASRPRRRRRPRKRKPASGAD
jgi:poly(A) polymerase